MSNKTILVATTSLSTPLLKLTPEQQAILLWIMEGSGHAEVIARAGTGKTFIALQGVRLMVPEGDRSTSVTLAMFNADIAAETRQKIAADGLRASSTTFHAAGWSALLRAYPKIKLSGKGPKQAGVDKWDLIVEKLDIPQTYRSFAHKAMSMAKQRAFGLAVKMSDPAAWLKIVDDFDLDTLISAEFLDSGLKPREDIIKEGLQWAFKALKTSNEMLDTIADHDDQIYGPLIRNLKLWENDWLIVDECFVGDTPILLGLDGTSRTIKDLYDTQYTGPIVSFDPVTKRTVIKRVLGAKRIPVGKPLVRLRTRQRGYGKNGVRLGALTETVRFGERTLICTEDHEIYSRSDWIPVDQLSVGQTVVHETSAPIDRHYQSRYAHTAAGRTALRVKADTSRFGTFYVPTKSEAFGGRRGGNGTGLSKHERLLLSRLGEGWKAGIVVPCGKGCRGKGLPPHYKLDIANPSLKIVVEIDGYSNRSRADADARKTTFLESQGWRVIRLLNREVLSLTNDALKLRIEECAVEAEVISVEPWDNREHEYVYDLSVEDTHCYFAHGLLVHNCQDTNPARRLLARKMVKRNGRTLWIGDPCQPLRTKVSVPGGGTVNIEDLRIGDKVVSYTPRTGKFVKAGRSINGITRRPYVGNLVVATGSGYEAKYTPNHICYASFIGLRDKFAVYAMRRGDQFRVGRCKMDYAASSGLSARLHDEKADAVWILALYDTEDEARLMEQAIAGRFGIPQLMFNAAKLARRNAETYLSGAWKFIHSNFDRGLACLRHFGREHAFPLFERETGKQQTVKRPIFIRACNLMDGIKMLPYKDSQDHATAQDWLDVKITAESYEGEVISLDVSSSKLYIADGIVNHNCQAIYGFTGADSDAMDTIAKEWNATILKLTTTFRCPKVAVRLANQFVPDYAAGENNIEGEYLNLSSEDFYKTEAKKLDAKSLILCRNTAPLVKVAFKLIGQGIACRVEGKDIGSQIVDLVNRWKRVKTLRTLRDRLSDYLDTQVAKLTKAGKDRQADSLADRVETVFAVIEGLPQGASLDDLKAKVGEMFQKTEKGEKPNVIRLMTLHRCKGLEAKTVVFLGRQELIPSKYAKKPEQLAQEDNLAYVGLTRVQEKLIEVRL